MEQNPCKPNSCIASPETAHILWYPTVRYCFHDSLPLVCTLSQMNPVHAIPFYFLMMHFNTKLPSMPMSSKWSPSFRLRHHNSIHIWRHHPRATRPTRLILISLVNLMIFYETCSRLLLLPLS